MIKSYVKKSCLQNKVTNFVEDSCSWLSPAHYFHEPTSLCTIIQQYDMLRHEIQRVPQK
jgi:hypothetical protein